MTDMVKKFNSGIESLEHGARAHALRRSAEAINLAAIFRARGINFGENEN